MNILGLAVIIIIRFYAIETNEPIFAKVWLEPTMQQCKNDASQIILQPDPPGVRTEIECNDTDIGVRLFNLGAKL